jgi:hypothetical protein
MMGVLALAARSSFFVDSKSTVASDRGELLP